MRIYMRNAMYWAVAAMSTMACTRQGSRSVSEPVATSIPKGESSASSSASTKPVTPSEPDPCQVLPGLEDGKPAYLTGKAVVLTRMLKPCVTRAGQKGFEKGSPWLAMGFPCTGGSGKIDIKGHYHNPKMVAFIVANDCAMSAGSKETVQKLFSEALKVPADSKVAAVNPFSVQYWEVPGLPDADTGFAVELRSAPGIEGGWKRVRDKEPLRVRLFGRENAWVRGEDFYEVEADLQLAGQTSFTINIVNVKTMSPDELEQLKQRCAALRPARNCSTIM